MANEQLSNAGTDLIKFALFPFVALVSLASTTAQTIVTPWHAVFLVPTIAGLVWIGKWLVRCQRVVESSTGLRIGKPGREIDVAYLEIARVKDTKLSSPRLIIVSLKSPGPLGSKIVFLARTEIVPLFGEHPVARLLRARASRTL